MLLNILIYLLFIITTIHAVPHSNARRKRHDRKGPIFRSNSTILSARGSSHTVYSPNWAGAVVQNHKVSHVTGTFNVPSVRSPANGDSSSSYSGSVWIGIDGYSCTSAILQAGFDFDIRDGQVSYNPWCEWWPANSIYWTGMTFSEGDAVRITIKADSSTSGSVVLENLTNRQSVSHTFEDQDEGHLCQTDAEWIVEDYQAGGSLVSLADFGAITFHGAQAVTETGPVGVRGATLVDMVASRESREVAVRASTGVPGKVVISHV